MGRSGNGGKGRGGRNSDVHLDDGFFPEAFHPFFIAFIAALVARHHVDLLLDGGKWRRRGQFLFFHQHDGEAGGVHQRPDDFAGLRAKDDGGGFRGERGALRDGPIAAFFRIEVFGVPLGHVFKGGVFGFDFLGDEFRQVELHFRRGGGVVPQHGDEDFLEFDFVLGSSHFVDRMDPYEREYWKHFGEKEGFRAFFEVSLKRVQNLLDTFDSYGHLDYVVRYAPHKNEFYSWNDYEPYIRPLLKLLIENGKCLECNTGGIRYGLGNTNPCADVFRLYKELGGEGITIGSDAHTPETLGIGFDFCREMLKEYGFRYYTVFHERKAEMLPL